VKFAERKSGENHFSLNVRRVKSFFVASLAKHYGETRNFVARVMEIGRGARILITNSFWLRMG
jgi:hypothetical protein